MKKIIYAILVVSFLIGVFIVASSRSSNPTSQNKNPATVSNNTNTPKTDLIIGQASAPVTLIEYGDFKCPSCNQFQHRAGKQLRSDYINTGKLKIVFRALTIIGPDSHLSAVGGYCANDQKKFADYHDAVYNFMWDNYYNKGDSRAEARDILTEDKLTILAESSGLDGTSFRSCLKRNSHSADITVDAQLATNDGVSGTPTFVIAKQIIIGPQPFDIFKKLIDIRLQQ